jgi:glycerophosphoryl diester phosphodiesterase
MRTVLFAVGLLLAGSLSDAQVIVAHRGASYDAPENTLAAFNLAWEQGADGIEADFYLSSDGQVVCIHDKDTKRTAGVNHLIAKTTYDVLRALDVGSWKDAKYKGERMPVCREVLATVPPGKLMIVELKVGPEIVEPVKRDLEASSLRPEQILIISFNEETVAECKRLMPHIRCHWLTGYKENGTGQVKPDICTVLETLRRTGADGLGTKAEPKHVNDCFLYCLRLGGFNDFHAWTIDDVETARYYQRLGTWGITTNRPGWLREQLGLPIGQTVQARSSRSTPAAGR